jgi:mRNA-degrading endonuclease HigB of HigAB toxin-antitoxin module
LLPGGHRTGGGAAMFATEMARVATSSIFREKKRAVRVIAKRTPQDIKDRYASASICGNNRVVFNVGGNKYRLVVEVQYQAGIVWVKFVGTHAQYDRIDVETVNEY